MKVIRTKPVGTQRALRPLLSFLDGCWIYYGGDGVSLDYGKFPERGKNGQLDPEREEAWRRAGDAAVEELGRWIVEPGLGKPGFFSRYAPGFHWTTHFAADGAEPPRAAFEWADRFGRDWFNLELEVPAEICVVMRDIDGAYHDFFFRDEWAYELVLAHGERCDHLLPAVDLTAPPAVPRGKRRK